MNLFDSANYPTREPAELIAGDRWAWKRTDLGSDYPPAAYQLKYSARLEGSDPQEIEITAVASGSDFVVEVPGTETGKYVPGRYQYHVYIVRISDSERVTLGGGGFFDVRANRDKSADDPRTHAKKVLDAIEAVIEGRASKDQEEYSISGRQLRRTPIPELLKLRDVYRAEVRGQEASAKLAAGVGTGRKIQVRF